MCFEYCIYSLLYNVYIWHNEIASPLGLGELALVHVCSAIAFLAGPTGRHWADLMPYWVDLYVMVIRSNMFYLFLYEFNIWVYDVYICL